MASNNPQQNRKLKILYRKSWDIAAGAICEASKRFVHNDACDVPQGLICRQTGHKSIVWMSNIQDKNEGAYLCMDIQYKN